MKIKEVEILKEVLFDQSSRYTQCNHFDPVGVVAFEKKTRKYTVYRKRDKCTHTHVYIYKYVYAYTYTWYNSEEQQHIKKARDRYFIIIRRSRDDRAELYINSAVITFKQVGSHYSKAVVINEGPSSSCVCDVRFRVACIRIELGEKY